MDKKILAHKEFIESEIIKLNSNSGKKDVEKARDLLEYHITMTRNFQHERAIHLAVTLFFAMLMVGAWVFCGWLILSLIDLQLSFVVLPSILLTLILTILEGFYISYYYRLENRIQKLYDLNQEIFNIIER